MSALPLCLTADELAELTDSRIAAAQISWLKEHRWPFELSRLGKPKVARAYFDKRMGVVEGSAPARDKTEPNWGALKAEA